MHGLIRHIEWRPVNHFYVIQAQAVDNVEHLDAVRSLDHPNVIRYLGQCHVQDGDSGQEPTSNIVMEPWQTDLERLLEVRKKFSPVEAVYIVKQILEGLDYLHGKNFVLG